MANNSRSPNTQPTSPEKVFDSSGIETSLIRDSLSQSFDNFQSQEGSSQKKSKNADLDNQANGIVNLNEIPVSPSTGSARTAQLDRGKSKHTIQISKDLQNTAYR